MRTGFFYIAFILLFSGCTDQRNLYMVSRPIIYIDVDWQPALQQSNMSMNATAVLYSAGGAQYSKNYFVSPTSVTIPVSRGVFDILLFNGLMYSETNTHLDDIFFRNTDRFSTFEAVTVPGEINRRLTLNPGEYVASNNMEILATTNQSQEITSEAAYSIKYQNGHNSNAGREDHIEASLQMTPVAVSYRCRIYVNLVNPGSAYVANGALRGFAGSVFLASRMPSSMEATHQFRLNDLQITNDDPETGTIRSPLFVTFGPPLDQPDRRYSIELSIVLVDGDTYSQTFDVTAQVEPLIEQIKANLGSAAPVNVNIEIPIEISAELPVVESLGGSIGVGDWEDDEIITIPVEWQ